VLATIVVVPAATVEVDAGLVEVVCGGSAPGVEEQAKSTASTSGRNLDAVIGSTPRYEHSEDRHLDALPGEDGTGRGEGVGPEQEMLCDRIDVP